jgi:hypothetical protein
MRTLVVSALLFCAGPTVCLAQEPQTVVDRFYPQQLTASGSDARHTCFMVLRLTSINEPDAIAAGYTDGAAMVLRLLTRVAPDIYVVSFETMASLRTTATTCRFTGPDLDGDGQPDVQLEVSSGTASSTWAFKWTGDTLVPRSVPAAGAALRADRLLTSFSSRSARSCGSRGRCTRGSLRPAPGRAAAAPSTAVYRPPGRRS